MGEAVTEAEFKRRPLKNIEDCDIAEKVETRNVTIVNMMSLRSEKIFINRVIETQDRIIKCMTPEGYRWLNADNIIKISRTRKAKAK